MAQRGNDEHGIEHGDAGATAPRYQPLSGLSATRPRHDAQPRSGSAFQKSEFQFWRDEQYHEVPAKGARLYDPLVADSDPSELLRAPQWPPDFDDERSSVSEEVAGYGDFELSEFAEIKFRGHDLLNEVHGITVLVQAVVESRYDIVRHLLEVEGLSALATRPVPVYPGPFSTNDGHKVKDDLEPSPNRLVSPLEVALRSEQYDIVKLLCAYGATLDLLGEQDEPECTLGGAGGDPDADQDGAADRAKEGKGGGEGEGKEKGKGQGEGEGDGEGEEEGEEGGEGGREGGESGGIFAPFTDTPDYSSDEVSIEERRRWDPFEHTVQLRSGVCLDGRYAPEFALWMAKEIQGLTNNKEHLEKCMSWELVRLAREVIHLEDGKRAGAGGVDQEEEEEEEEEVGAAAMNELEEEEAEELGTGAVGEEPEEIQGGQEVEDGPYAAAATCAAEAEVVVQDHDHDHGAADSDASDGMDLEEPANEYVYGDKEMLVADCAERMVRWITLGAPCDLTPLRIHDPPYGFMMPLGWTGAGGEAPFDYLVPFLRSCFEEAMMRQISLSYGFSATILFGLKNETSPLSMLSGVRLSIIPEISAYLDIYTLAPSAYDRLAQGLTKFELFDFEWDDGKIERRKEGWRNRLEGIDNEHAIIQSSHELAGIMESFKALKKDLIKRNTAATALIKVVIPWQTERCKECAGCADKKVGVKECADLSTGRLLDMMIKEATHMSEEIEKLGALAINKAAALQAQHDSRTEARLAQMRYHKACESNTSDQLLPDLT